MSKMLYGIIAQLLFAIVIGFATNWKWGLGIFCVIFGVPVGITYLRLKLSKEYNAKWTKRLSILSDGD